MSLKTRLLKKNKKPNNVEGNIYEAEENKCTWITLHLHLSPVQGWSIVQKYTDKGYWHSWALMVLRDNRGFLANPLQSWTGCSAWQKTIFTVEFWTAHDKVPHGSLLLKLKAAGAPKRSGDKIYKNKTKQNTVAEKQHPTREKCWV